MYIQVVYENIYMQMSTNSDLERAAKLKKIYNKLDGDPMLWGRMFFPKHFSLDSPQFHSSLVELATKHRHLVVAAPRGSAKSTLLAFLYPFHAITFKKKRFILIISNTFKKAAMHLDSIKREVSSNAEFRDVLGSIELVRDAEGDSEFKHPSGYETKVLCKGIDQLGSIRGVKFSAYRPDLVIIDDMEDDEMVKNPQRRAELKDEFDEVLDQVGDKFTQFIIVGTILHDDSQLSKMLQPDQYTDFKKVVLQAHLLVNTPSECSLWPAKWTVDDLRKLMREKPNVYAKEMQNDPVAGTNTRFKRSDFRYYKEDNGRLILLDVDGSPIQSYAFKDCRAAISCDLAWKEKRTSDSSVIMPGLITPNSEILVLDYVSKKGMRPDETAEHLFSMEERLRILTGGVIPIGFEKAMLENVTQWLLRREMQKRNKFLLTQELVWDSDKNTRIEVRLQPRIAQHVIYFKKNMGSLEHQLERFPYGSFDDEIDCLQGLVQLLQFPKAHKQVQDDDQFMRLRKLAIDQSSSKRTIHKYHGRNKFPFPVQKSIF